MNMELTEETIKRRIAATPVIYEKGLSLFQSGAFVLKSIDSQGRVFNYRVDGSHGDYDTRVEIEDEAVRLACSCPYPEDGCKHAVAVLLDVKELLRRRDLADLTQPPAEVSEDDCLTPEEIRRQALEDRQKRAKSESFRILEGEMIKGEHLVETGDGRQYTVTLHDPVRGAGHCSCPDFQGNRLGTCKHLMHVIHHFKRRRDFKTRTAREIFPFFDLYWDSTEDRPRLFFERSPSEIDGLAAIVQKHFDKQGFSKKTYRKNAANILTRLCGIKALQVQPTVLARLEREFQRTALAQLEKEAGPMPVELKTPLYPYQEEGVRFGLYKDAVLIGDEMGLGKTLQAIALALGKKALFGFEKTLVITPASLKEQWKREIEKFSEATAVIVEGPPARRRQIYEADEGYFKVANYEAVLRDVTLLKRLKPDLVILDEAQRIKNFSTKTAAAVKSIPRRHAVVLTGTPLENRLEDVYSIVQFLDPLFLAPLWQFAADHYMLSRKKKGHILGYRNLGQLHQRLKPLVIRRRKDDVLEELPDELVNNYYLDLDWRQQEIHAGYAQILMPLLNKKFLTPMDLRRIQELLLCMRMVCDSTYLIDRKTQISPKLKEFEGILDELVVQNRRKMVVFSEWTTMTYLIGRRLSEAGIPFVELSGKIPVKKRQALIDEFTYNPDCRVFLSTDAGGTGLNLQAADCVLNFELPWNPAKLRQRIGRVNRIGQKSRIINVVNLITKNSIEEKILAGLQLKTDLFQGVFDGGLDEVEFSREKRTELLNKLRAMMGDELLPSPAAESTPAELPEDTPHYLNPEVLAKAEENLMDPSAEEADALPDIDRENGDSGQKALAEASPEKLEEVFNSGLSFISGLMEMATGQKLEPSGEQDRLLKIDKATGEVTMKFKLPGFCKGE